MEHDRDDSDNDFKDILDDVDETTGEMDFESYLKERTCRLDPVSEMREIPINDSPASTVAESSSSQPTSQPSETDETSESTTLQSAVAAEEKTTRLELHTHKIVGPYITEHTEPVQYDADWQKVFDDSKRIAVVDMKPEDVIKRFHELDRTVFLIKAQQMGLRVGLEELLKAETASERARLLEMERGFKARQAKKAIDSIRERRQKPGKSTAGKTKGMKTADTLKGLMMPQEAIEKQLQTLGLFDDATRAYVAKLFA